jgi:CDP-6-deoxy-D-xylo-4-hexulose-3-dehydrase
VSRVESSRRIEYAGSVHDQREIDAVVARWPHLFTLPRLTAGVATGWHMFPFLVNAGSGIRRGELQQWMERHGVDTRMVWTGNVTRQPAFGAYAHRVPHSGLPNADRVMEWGLILPNNHAMDDDDCHYMGECIEAFLEQQAIR